ncbi:MAG: sugar kinase [Alkalibacterium sp.]|nr:sugar kinase [Alkalibacterium sp.]
MTDVILLGEPMGLFTATDRGSLKEAINFDKSIAGAEVNVGIGLSRLGFNVQYVTRLGKEPIGEYIFEGLQDEGIGTDFITFDQTHTSGLMLKNKVNNGDPKTAYYRKNSAFTTLSMKDIEHIDFSTVKLLHVTGIPLALGDTVKEAVLYLMKKARDSGTFITFDPNLRPALWSSEKEMIEIINQMSRYAQVVLPGVAEGKTLVGTENIEDIASFYLENGADVVITKSGERGAFVTVKGKATVNIPGFKVEKVVDTVGAGDGFAVGIISGFLYGLSWEESAVRANAIGALQVQHVGDNEGLPNKEELDHFITERNSTRTH